MPKVLYILGSKNLVFGLKIHLLASIYHNYPYIYLLQLIFSFHIPDKIKSLSESIVIIISPFMLYGLGPVL